MTRVVRVHRLGGPEELRIDDIELHAPGRGRSAAAGRGHRAQPRRSDVSVRQLSR